MPGSYRSYSTMQESGVQWLGAIPKHWEIVRSRRLFSERKDRMRPGDAQLTASQKYGVIPQQEFMRREGQNVMQVFKGAEILKHVEPNDFVMSMRSFRLTLASHPSNTWFLPSSDIYSRVLHTFRLFSAPQILCETGKHSGTQTSSRLICRRWVWKSKPKSPSSSITRRRGLMR